MEFDYKILEEKIRQLPPEMQRALTSAEISENIQTIGNRHGLRLDQESVLYDMSGYVMLGLLPSKDFVKKFSQEAGVSEEIARKIADDINQEVFGKIRSSLQENDYESVEDGQKSDDGTISALERAGGFSLEKENAETSPYVAVTETDREKVLASLEDKDTDAEKTSGSVHKEPLIDHLLANAVGAPEEKVEKRVAPPPATPATKPQPRPRTGPDPYREPIQ